MGYVTEPDLESLIDTDALDRLCSLNRARSRPRATYRIQFHAGFTFKHATAIVPYLSDLGISHLYASPIFAAAPGSMHGYDIVDFNRLNPLLGSADDFDRLADALKAHDMRLMLDFVPNHMGTSAGQNLWWQDVLENGQTSAFVSFFDIDWEPLKPELGNKILLPILGDQYGVILENGDLRLEYENGDFRVSYYETPLPIAPPSYSLILEHVSEMLSEEIEEDDIVRLELESLIASFHRLPGQDERDSELIAERRREQVISKRRLAELVTRSPAIESALDRAIVSLNGEQGAPQSFDRLDGLLEVQSYRLAFWRVAAEEINYRRFFAINELAAVRQEVPEVFNASHGLLMRLIREGCVDSVRIDHPDGLWNPAEYVRNLQRAAFTERYLADQSIDPDCDPEVRTKIALWWNEKYRADPDDSGLRSIYLVVEKIVGHDESLPSDWLVDGTVGYEFNAATSNLFVQSESERAFNVLFSKFSGPNLSFPDLAYEKKKLMLRISLASEFSVLARVLDRITEHQRRTRDFTLNSLRDALRETIACFPIYRTYITTEDEQTADRDKRAIESAIRDAKRRNPYPDVSIFDFIQAVLLGEEPDDVSGDEADDRARFRMKFQQLTSPVMAKGVEDTVFYIFNRLSSLNEVGGEPSTFGMAAGDVHKTYVQRRSEWPGNLLTSSTHDTKRSEDVRARIHALSESPREWRASVNRWALMNRKFRTRANGTWAPDKNDEYLLYQTLVGSWPIGTSSPDVEYVNRIVAYMEKATREAQVRTSWTNPDPAYDDAMAQFVRKVLDPVVSSKFIADFVATQHRYALTGAVNSLSQQILKLTTPGVPDIYQGTELWDFSLVDPDNRRPVNFDQRVKTMKTFTGKVPSSARMSRMLNNWDNAAIKLLVTRSLLLVRKSYPDLFEHGDYVPLIAGGPNTDRLFSFARSYGHEQLIVVVPHLVDSLLRDTSEVTQLATALGGAVLQASESILGGTYRQIFSDRSVHIPPNEEIALMNLFQPTPFSVLIREAGDS